MFLLCSSDFGRSLEESRDDLQSLGYDTPVPLIRSDSYTTLLDATRMVDGERGFEGFQLLRPIKGDDRYFVVTTWDSEASFDTWRAKMTSHTPPAAGQKPIATGADLLEFEVVDLAR